MKRMIAVVFAVLVLGAALSWAGSQQAPLSTEELKQNIGKGKKPTIVFFQNPYGGPCMAQKEIINSLLKDRKRNFNVANVSTLREEDQKAFYDYGVRSLPSLVLVDRNGNISRVFPPGIQPYDTLAAALNGLK